MQNKRLIFVCGTHRSGTSLLHRLVRAHPLVSGFAATGVPEDQGQHLQDVYPPAWRLGGPGRFARSSLTHMDETHSLATPGRCRPPVRPAVVALGPVQAVPIEKSPPNVATLVRYEDLAADPAGTWAAACDVLGLPQVPPAEPVRPDANDGYFGRWERAGVGPDAARQACERAARPLG